MMLRELKSCYVRNDLMKLRWLRLKNKLDRIRIKFFTATREAIPGINSRREISRSVKEEVNIKLIKKKCNMLLG